MSSEFYEQLSSVDWNLAKQTILKKNEDLDYLLNKGYEIVRIHYNFRDEGSGEGLIGHIYVGLYCKICEVKFINALSTPIFEYVSHFFELYDKAKKRPSYT